MTPPYQWVQRMSRVLISLRQRVCPNTLGAQRGGSLFVQWKNIVLLPSRRPRISLFSSRDLLNLSDPDPLFVSADSNFTSELFHDSCPPFLAASVFIVGRSCQLWLPQKSGRFVPFPHFHTFLDYDGAIVSDWMWMFLMSDFFYWEPFVH